MTQQDDPLRGRSPVTVDDEQSMPVDREALRQTALRALRALPVPEEAQLFITLVDAERIAEMKEQALGIRSATDVLSFPIDSIDAPAPGPLVLGEVVICPAVAERQARGLGRRLSDELDQLLVHGILHVLGREHEDARAELAMAREERALLRPVPS